MPLPDISKIVNNRLIQEELDYNELEQKLKFDQNITKLNSDQENVYQKVLTAPQDGIDNMFFVDGPGGTGKSFLFNVILTM